MILKQHQNKQSLKNQQFFFLVNFCPSKTEIIYYIHVSLSAYIDQNDQKKKLGKEILDRSLGNIHYKQ
jgi:hypothetical protein